MTDVVHPEANLLLARLAARDRHRLLRHFDTVALERDQQLYEVGQPVEYFHFPERGCLLSLVKFLDDGRSFDAGLIGYEGLAGVEGFLCGLTHFGATVRIGGPALRARVPALQADVGHDSKWMEVIRSYLQFLLVYVSQVAGCNRFHSLERRFCAALLTVQDRVKADELEITHDLLARMMGVRRVGITQAARKLQAAGLIRYSWGKITIRDRPGLKANACVCYRQHTEAYQRLLDPAWPYE